MGRESSHDAAQYLDRDVAGEMAKIGYPVVGIDTLRYYWQHKTPEQSANLLYEMLCVLPGVVHR